MATQGPPPAAPPGDRRIPARALDTAAVAAAGTVFPLACTHTAGWALAPAAVAVLVWRLGRASTARAAWLGGVFGTAWLLAAVWWLHISMHRYGGLTAGLAALAVLALAVALSSYLALACAAWARWRSGRPARDAALFAALWLLAECARAVWFTGFPWAASGYTQVDAPLAGLAPWVGVHGMGAALAFAAALLALGVFPSERLQGTGTGTGVDGPPPRRPGRRRALHAAAALAALVGPAALRPLDFTTSAGRATVTLLQPQVAQDEKFSGVRVPQTLAWLDQALRQARGQLVVAPETAVPLLPGQLAVIAPGWWPALVEHFQRSDQTALVGVPLGSFESGYTNSAVGLLPGQGQAYRYDKAHLVPFGEFIPRGFRWFTDLLQIPLGDFGRGPLDAPSLPVAGQRAAPNICYEDLFGEELAVRFVDAARAPTVLVNLSNIAWFGNTVAIPQHLNISRLRALELQRPMLRATNTGATAIVDHRGRVTHRLPPQQRGVLEGAFDGRTGTTPYASWAGRWGLWPLVVLALALVAACARRPGGPGRADPRS
jgi:apolipoprotein N-acyltransferase